MEIITSYSCCHHLEAKLTLPCCCLFPSPEHSPSNQPKTELIEADDGDQFIGSWNIFMEQRITGCLKQSPPHPQPPCAPIPAHRQWPLGLTNMDPLFFSSNMFSCEKALVAPLSQHAFKLPGHVRKRLPRSVVQPDRGLGTEELLCVCSFAHKEW